MADSKTPDELRVIARRLIHRRADGVVVPPSLIRMYAEALQTLAEKRERRANLLTVQSDQISNVRDDQRTRTNAEWIEGYFEALADARSSIRRMASDSTILRERKLGLLAAASIVEDMIKSELSNDELAGDTRSSPVAAD